MDEALLDSDILSEILKAKNQIVLDAAKQYLAQRSRFAFSSITLYEITRGFRATRAVRGLAKFRKLVDDSDVLPVSIPVLLRAAEL
jgi:tRNA(fMet)-specific endonuclease VapC